MLENIGAVLSSILGAGGAHGRRERAARVNIKNKNGPRRIHVTTPKETGGRVQHDTSKETDADTPTRWPLETAFAASELGLA